MSKKAVNWLFLVLLLVEAAVVCVIYFTGVQLSTVAALVLNQLIFLVPAVLFMVGTKTKPGEILVHKRIHPGTCLLCVVFTGLCIPLIMVVNMVSMLFVENTANQLADALAGTPAWLMILVVGILAPMSEEFIFRGIFYQSYKKTGRVVAAMLMSAFLFGLMHLNFNQMSYAFVVGILGVLLLEATGNIASTMIFHACINTGSVIIMLFQQKQSAVTGVDSQEILNEFLLQNNMTYIQYMKFAITIYGMMALVTTMLAILLLYAISLLEKQNGKLTGIFQGKHSFEGEPKVSLWSVPLAVAVVLSLAYMIIDLVGSALM